MKKTFSLIFIIVMVFLFSACHKDGVFNPSKKIQEIVSVSDSTQQVEEVWHWDGNLLSKIDFFYSNELSDVITFTYDKNRLDTEEHPLTNEFTKYIYEGNNLVENDFYEGNQCYGKAVYEKDHGKISRIEITATETDKMSNILSHIFPPQICKQIHQYETEHWRAKGSNMNYLFLLTWANGNVSEIDVHFNTEDSEHGLIIKASYDKHKNPFKGSSNEYLSPESYLSTLSQNNITFMSIGQEGTTPYTETYEYEYEDNYPVSVSISSSSYKSSIITKKYIYQ